MDADALEVAVSVRSGGFAVEAAFRVPPGITVLFGPSGSGKTTLLRAVAGLLTPLAGRVALGGDPWFDSARGIEVPPDRRKLSMVFQGLSLFPHMTALGNVEYGIDRAVPAPERRKRARAALARMRVAHVEERRPSTFSGGEAQRVALARAFARQPRLILLDEAFSAMDRELREELGADVQRAVAELAIPAIVVTHLREEARALGTRAVLLRKGRVEAEGDASAVVPSSDREP